MGLTKRLLDIRIKPNKAKLREIERMRSKQIRRADSATTKTLDRFGAIIRQDARKLIGQPSRPRKITKKMVMVPVVSQSGRTYLRRQNILVSTPPPKPRPPGKPPKDRGKSDYMSLRNIIYKTDRQRSRVRIGTVQSNGKTYNGKTVPDLHEFGATITVRIRRIPTITTMNDLKKRTNTTSRGKKIQSLTKVRSGMDIIESIGGTSTRVKIPKRPYMRPAFQRHKSKATKIWKEYYQATRGRR